MVINEPDNSRLNLWLAKALSSSMTSIYGVHIDEEITDPDINDSLKASLAKHLDRGGLREFVECEFFQDVLKNDLEIPLNGDHINTTDLPLDIFSHSVRLMDGLKSLPRQYCLYVRGPRVISESVRGIDIDYAISDRLRLVSARLLSQDVLFTGWPQQYHDWIYRNSELNILSLNSDYLYFVFYASGFLPHRFNPQIIEDMLHELRAFYGACIAHGLLYPYSSDREYVTPQILVTQKTDARIIHISSLDTDLINCMHLMPMSTYKKFRKRETFISSMSPITDFFKCGSPKLKTAATWVLRANLSSRPIDQILESAIALEVLLGDQKMSDKVGLTKLMANRCAYAIGVNSQDRDRLIEFFQEFYRIRSEIVHTGRYRDTEQNSEIVDRGVSLTSQILVYEQKLSLKS